MDSISARAPAKVNFFLNIVGSRSDGWHDLVMVNQTVTLFDSVEVEPISGERDCLVVAGPFRDGVPTDESNTILRLLGLCRERQRALPFFRVLLEKEIPMGSGLGGGSADAAAVLRCLRPGGWLAGCEEDTKIATEVGADVPFALAGGAALVTGRGENVAPIEPQLGGLCLILVGAGIHISTSWAYVEWDRCGGAGSRKPVESLLRAMEAGEYEGLMGGVHNDFERVIFPVYPQLAEIRDRLYRLGCDAAWMTGSGSTMVGLCRNEAHALEVARKVENGPWWIRIVRPVQP